MSRSKRHRDYPDQPEPGPESGKKHQHSNSEPTFPSYLDSGKPLPPKIKLLCAIVAEIHCLSVEETLNDTGIRVSQHDVEEVLKLSYAFPGPALKFFRWSGRQLNEHHSPYAWNLVVDLLGKNCFFDAMWDAIKSMNKERLLSLATFASVFSSYVVADKTPEAIMTFEVMDQYGVARDIVAFNSLLSAICRDGKTSDAFDFYYIAKDKIRPDADTYAILLEGWESEGNVASATKVLDEMVSQIGWDPTNVPAYDSYLNTLLKGNNGICVALDFFDTLKAKRCYPGVKFFRLALDECVNEGNVGGAEALWEAMVGGLGLQADTSMYNLMISLHCHGNNISVAKRMLDEMVYNGAFPNSQTYNMVFKMLIKNRKLQEAGALFTEMIKNECILDQVNCTAAVRIYLDLGDPYFAIKVWKFMIENYHSGLEETGNFLVLGLRDMNRVPEAVKYAEDMILRGIKLSSSSMSKLKDSLVRAKKEYMYVDLASTMNTVG
ncbi:PREDICTED: pentatricopeptide repeat-containing protein At1g77360, mitochondrial-like [Fragaria vesca subsp. vesca]|uniref:pentatricopeptide repeat-containing protein At1g77360, mitochondrial-like n=1 Tax=Fragaria vesca subsp. vesca TaxID=101020 RepID=UPI0002C31E2F|nr:PREDICTED: pentatricopeptide repeat-containing protein At1g77360, mitochondrial-like [Fragaria vesca subsp. vesca]